MNGKDVRIGVSLLVSDMENMVRFYRDTLGFQTQWNGGPFADFETASGELSLFMYSRKEFVKAIGEDYVLPVSYTHLPASGIHVCLEHDGQGGIHICGSRGTDGLRLCVAFNGGLQLFSPGFHLLNGGGQL